MELCLSAALALGVGVALALGDSLAVAAWLAVLAVGLALILSVRHRLPVLFAALLVCTLVFGKHFSTLTVGPAYATELVLVAVGSLLVLAWLGGDARLARMPRQPMLAVTAYLAAGLIAVAVGWSNSDHYWLLRDSVLAGYALIIPLVIALFHTGALVRWITNVLLIAAIAGNIAWLGGLRYPAVAFALYTGFAILPPIVRWACGERVPLWQWAAVVGMLALQVSLATRTMWIALAAACTVLIATRPPRAADVSMLAILATSAALAFVAYALPHLDTQQNAVLRGAVGIAPGQASAEAQNSSWRLAFWKHDLQVVAHRPLTGVGFGPPANFCYSQNSYCDDTRTSRDATTVSGPHNSFVNILFRMGLLGLTPLLVLLWLAVRSALRSVRAADREGRAQDGADGRLMIVLFVYACVSASFSVALENPYMGLPFWAVVGLLFVVGRPGGGEARGSRRVDQAPDPRPS